MILLKLSNNRADSTQPFKIFKEKRYLLKFPMFLIVSVIISANSYAEPIYSSFDSRFAQGLDHYKKSKFIKSMIIFNELFLKHPGCYRCVYYKGKSSGKLASEANWINATKLAVETLHSFKEAYRLNPTDYEVTRDLAKYYMMAPKVLGGDIRKANELILTAEKLKETLSDN